MSILVSRCGCFISEKKTFRYDLMGRWTGPIAAIDVMVTRKISALVRIESLFMKPLVSFFYELKKLRIFAWLCDQMFCGTN